MTLYSVTHGRELDLRVTCCITFRPGDASLVGEPVTGLLVFPVGHAVTIMPVGYVGTSLGSELTAVEVVETGVMVYRLLHHDLITVPFVRGEVGIFWLRLYQEGKSHVATVTEVPGNPALTVTNGISEIAKALVEQHKIEPDQLVLYEMAARLLGHGRSEREAAVDRPSAGLDGDQSLGDRSTCRRPTTQASSARRALGASARARWRPGRAVLAPSLRSSSGVEPATPARSVELRTPQPVRRDD